MGPEMEAAADCAADLEIKRRKELRAGFVEAPLLHLPNKIRPPDPIREMRKGIALRERSLRRRQAAFNRDKAVVMGFALAMQEELALMDEAMAAGNSHAAVLHFRTVREIADGLAGRAEPLGSSSQQHEG